MSSETTTRRINAFQNRFGQAHLDLACHAAFPLSLTPDLLYRLWANFQRDSYGNALNIPWIAVSDVLLSSFCNEVGHELYEMDVAVRNALLNQLKADSQFGTERIHELSNFLLAYIQQQLESHDPDIRDFAQTQRWTALAYVQPGETARQLALTLSKLSLENKTEWVRMASLTETFAEPLADFEPLLIYTRGMEKLACGNQEEAQAQFSQIPRQKQQINVRGINLRIPRVQLPNKFEFEQLLKIADEVVTRLRGQGLNDVERTILQGSWEAKSYEVMAYESDYSDIYLKQDVGPKLWKLLSEALGRKVSKKTIRTAFESYIPSTPLPLEVNYVDNSLKVESDFDENVLTTRNISLNFENVLRIADEAVTRLRGQGLNDVERTILQGSWEVKSYEVMAYESDYSDIYLKQDVGPKLWKLLSEALGRKVSKKTIRTAFELLISQHSQNLKNLSTDAEVYVGVGNRDITLDEERLYQHFRDCLRHESSRKVIERFRQLFIEASEYPDSQIWQSLLRLTNPEHNPAIESKYKHIINGCCYTLINLWQLEQRHHSFIPELIGLFEQLPTDLGSSPITRRLRESMRSFLETEQYATLRRLPQVLFETDDPTAWQDDQILGSLLQRYPYLYDYCLLTKDSDSEHKHNINVLKDRTQKKFETDLARFDNYRTGRSRLEHVANPTLLSDLELGEALDHYLDRSDKRNTHKKSAIQFASGSKMIHSYREFKEELSDYLIAPVAAAEPRYANQFKRRLRRELQNLFVDSDSQQINDFLVNETCRRLLNVLVIESRNSRHHTFVDLIGNIGYAPTVGLLLRIVLFCRTVKPWLEQRFAILFDHYESNKRAEVGWLVTALEHVNIALSTNFGSFSFKAS